MLGILGGTSFHETGLLTDGEERLVETPMGAVRVHCAGGLALIARHGREGRTPPHSIDHHAHLTALARLGAGRIVSFGSVGSLKPELPPGTLLVPDDYFAPFRVVTFHHDRIRFTVPGFDPDWRGRVIDALRGAELRPVTAGVYVETLGPRFETPAEVRWLATVGDVVGMTCAAEATLARELEIPLAAVCMVDNFAHGIGAEPLTGKAFRRSVRENRDTVARAFRAVAALATAE